MKQYYHAALSVAPLLSLLLFFGAASAQEKEDTLHFVVEQVVIVGTRSSERIIDIPYSVFVVDKKELSYGKKVSAKDVLADVPGLFLQFRYGHDLRLSIRGFGTRSNSGVRGIRILQDGIPESEPDGETVIDAIDFTSLGGVEVVKGNLSSLYANAPGGVVNFLSDIYFPHSFAGLTNQAGANGLRQNGFKLGLENNDNRILFSYNYRSLQGFRQHSQEYQHLANAVYQAAIGKKSTLTVLGNYVTGLSKIPGSLTRAEFDADPFQPDPLAISFDYKRLTQKGRLAVRYQTAFDETNKTELELTGYGGIKEFERTDNQYYSFSTRYSLGSFIRFTHRSEIFDRHNLLTTGMDFAMQSGPVTSFDNANGQKGISVQSEFNESLDNVGFYFYDRFNLIEERLALLVSARFDRYVFRRDIRIPFGFTDTLRAFQRATPKAGLNFKLTPSIALYTSYGLGYDFPALSEMDNNQLTSRPGYSINPDLEPQKSNNFELGVKGSLINFESEFMRKMYFDITFFKYLIRDEIVPFVLSQKTYFRNAARTNKTGLEVGVKCEPVEGFELTTNYMYANFNYEDYLATIYGPSGTTQEDYTNNVVPSVPKHILNLILNYEFELTEHVSGLLQWDCDYISGMFVNDKNSESAPAYFYGNFLAGTSLALGDAALVAYAGVSNIFDRRYVGFININDFNGRYYEPGEPRSVFMGLKINYQF